MGKTTANWARMLSIIALTAGGCVGEFGRRELPASPSESLRNSLGTIAIVCDNTPELELRTAKARGKGAGAGAVAGLVEGLAQGAGTGSGGNIGGLLIWAIAIPVATVYGAIKGAHAGPPQEELEAADRELRSAVGDTIFSQVLRNDLIAEAADSAHRTLRLPAALPE